MPAIQLSDDSVKAFFFLVEEARLSFENAHEGTVKQVLAGYGPEISKGWSDLLTEMRLHKK